MLNDKDILDRLIVDGFIEKIGPQLYAILREFNDYEVGEEVGESDIIETEKELLGEETDYDLDNELFEEFDDIEDDDDVPWSEEDEETLLWNEECDLYEDQNDEVYDDLD